MARGRSQRASTRQVQLPAPRIVSPLQALEDRRVWHPERAYRPALSFGRRSRIVVAKSSVSSSGMSTIPSSISFDVPKKVAVCVRRKQRREVLFAKGKGGGKVSRRRRRNYWSSVNC